MNADRQSRVLPEHVFGRSDALAATALAALAILAFWPGFSAGFVWEDITHVVANDTLRGIGGLVSIWADPGATQQYYPLFYTSLWLQFQAFGPEPFGFHVVGILLHAVNGMILFYLLRQLSVKGAWLAAALFLAHPINVESAVFVTEQSNVLALTFFLLSLLAWCRYTGLIASVAHGRRSEYVLCVFFFLCALLTKTITFTAPFVMAALVWWKHGTVARHQLNRLLPLVGLSVAFGAITLWIERTYLGAVGDQFGFSVLDRLLIAGRTAWFYVGKLFWPADLSPIYEHWTIEPGSFVQWLFPVGMALVVALAWYLRSFWGRALFAGILIYLILLFPALGLIDYSFMRYSVFVGDHFQYFAGIAIITLAVGGVFHGLKRIDVPHGGGYVAGLLIVAGLAAGSWRLSGIYREPATFWNYAVTTRPEAYLAHNNYGAYLASIGRTSEAWQQYEQALELYDRSPGVHVNLGTTLLTLGQAQDAIGHYERAIELLPSYPLVYSRYANALELDGRREEAISYYRQALDRNSGDTVALNNLAWQLAVHPSSDVRDGTEAVVLAERAHQLIGDDVNILDTLAAAHAEAGNYERAVEIVSQAIELAPANQQPVLEQRKSLYTARIPLRQ